MNRLGCPSVFVCSPLKGDGRVPIENNLVQAQMVSCHLRNLGCIPVTPHLFYSASLVLIEDRDDSFNVREMGLEASKRMIQMCDFAVASYPASSGMQDEINIIRQSGISLYRFDLYNFEKGIERAVYAWRRERCKTNQLNSSIPYSAVKGRNVIWLMGAPGAGKTFVADWLAYRYKMRAVHIGQMMRRRYGERRILTMSSRYAPEELDAEIMTIIRHENAHNSCPIVVDSWPRSARQVAWMSTISPPEQSLVIDVQTYKGMLKSRILQRGEYGRNLGEQALEEYHRAESEIFTELHKRGWGMEVFYVRNDG